MILLIFYSNREHTLQLWKGDHSVFTRDEQPAIHHLYRVEGMARAVTCYDVHEKGDAELYADAFYISTEAVSIDALRKDEYLYLKKNGL